MNQREAYDNLLDELAAGAPIEPMRARLDRLIDNQPRRSVRPRPWLAWAAALALAVAGLLAYRWQAREPTEPGADARVALQLLEAPSTFARLRGVNLAADLPHAWDTLGEALLERLEQDESVNVRLSAIEVLLSRDLPAPEEASLSRLLLSQETAIVQAHLGHHLLRRRLLSRRELEHLLDSHSVLADARNAVIRQGE